MHIVIVGAGRIGRSLAEQLISEDHELAVVDWNKSHCTALDESLGGLSIEGDATDTEVLNKAGAARADLLIATTKKDDVNLVTCQIAKHYFKISRTVSLVSAKQNVQLFRTLGVDIQIDINTILIGQIQEELGSQKVIRLISLPGIIRKSLVAIKIPLNWKAQGRSIKDLGLSDHILASLIISPDGNTSIPHEDILIQAGDQILFIATPESEKDLRNLILKE